MVYRQIRICPRKREAWNSVELGRDTKKSPVDMKILVITQDSEKNH